MFAQMCGIAALVFYTSSVFEDVGFSGVKSRILSASLTTSQTFCAIIPVFLIDRFGRRKVFMITDAGLALASSGCCDGWNDLRRPCGGLLHIPL
jgi:MFS family permease